METFSALLALCAGNSPVTGEFSAQRQVTRRFDVFFDLRLDKCLIKHSWRWWFETPSRWLWRHCNDNTTMGHEHHAVSVTGHSTHAQQIVWAHITNQENIKVPHGCPFVLKKSIGDWWIQLTKGQRLWCFIITQFKLSISKRQVIFLNGRTDRVVYEF